MLQGRAVVFPAGSHTPAPFVPTSPLPGVATAMQKSIVVRVSEDVLSNVMWALAVKHALDFPAFNITIGILQKNNYTVKMTQNTSSVQFPYVAFNDSGAVLAMNVEVAGVPAALSSGAEVPPSFTSAFLLEVRIWVTHRVLHPAPCSFTMSCAIRALVLRY